MRATSAGSLQPYYMALLDRSCCRPMTPSDGRSGCVIAKRQSATAKRRDIASVYHDGLTALGPQGDMARGEGGRRIASFGNAENESYGIEYGYAYEQSPVVCA